MKKTISIFAALLITAFAFAQKKELKAAEKALNKGNTTEAKEAIASAESLIDGADAKYKAQFYFLKGQTYFQMGNKGMDAENSFQTASNSFKQLLDFERAQKKFKYTKDAKPLMQQMTSKMVDNAIKAQQAQDYKKAADILYATYKMDTSNKDYLYYAASNSITAKEYDDALKYYEELKDANYTGVKTEFYAVNIATGQKESFPDKTVRDFSVRGKTHKDPSEKKTKSRLPEIIKNISWIYSNHVGDNEKALVAVDEAIAANPDDASLLLAKGKIYYDQGKTDKFKEIMQEIIAKNPNDADSHYNIGVISAENGQVEEARKAYKRVLELDPAYENAAINLSKTYIDEAADVVEKMNKLGNSSADNKKFEELQEQQTALYRKALGVLEAIAARVPNNPQILRQLKGLYSFLGEDAKMKEVKAKLEAMGQ